MAASCDAVIREGFNVLPPTMEQYEPIKIEGAIAHAHIKSEAISLAENCGKARSSEARGIEVSKVTGGSFKIYCHLNGWD